MAARRSYLSRYRTGTGACPYTSANPPALDFFDKPRRGGPVCPPLWISVRQGLLAICAGVVRERPLHKSRAIPALRKSTMADTPVRPCGVCQKNLMREDLRLCRDRPPCLSCIEINMTAGRPRSNFPLREVRRPYRKTNPPVSPLNRGVKAKPP